MPENTPTPDLLARIAALEAELARVKTERDIYKADVYATIRKDDPEYTLTEEEIQDALHGPRGQPLLDIVSEFERELRQP